MRIRMAAWALALAAGCAAATDYPSRPVRLIIGYAPGGNTDLIGRVFASGMQKKLGQNVVVENRPGAAAAIARDVVAKAAPDGYTLLTDATSLPGYAAFNRHPAIDVQRAFASVSLLTESPGALVVRADAPYNSWPDFITYAKHNPGKVNYAGIGQGIILLTFESAKAQYGIDVVAVDYKSSADAYRAVLTGDAHITSSSIGRIAGDVAAGKVKALVTSLDRRHPAIASTPTGREVGFNGYYSSWQGLWGPAGMPMEIVRALHAAVVDAVSQKEVRDSLEKLEAIPIASTPDKLSQRLDRDIREWREIITAAKIPLQ